ncbi:MAG: heme lyase CcmF/NrfE family subunit [Gammaproteobacteria bacterium]
MIPEIGHFALILAFAVACVQVFYSFAGAARNEQVWMDMARPAALLQCLLVSVAFITLAISFVNDDFTLLYVAQNSNSALPTMYKVAAVWGAHEGSLLLWILILTVWTAAVAVRGRVLENLFHARVLGTLGFVAVGFYLFTLTTSNPFERLLPAATEGRDLNPLLQDPAMVIHPPMLYVGYVGMSVAFAFTIAALLGREESIDWARRARPWTTVAWLFLTLGIALGSWWAYYELGWGGWWFWDPVENASFMPWLVGTALIHSLAVTEKRGAFTSWTMLLAIMAFSLSLLGTFLVRSGVLVSVHAFATDPARGVFILLFLGIVIGTALSLYAWRAPSFAQGGGFTLFSKETFLLSNNILLVVAAGAVLLGTLYPLFLDAMNMGKISVGPPYFNAVFVPLVLPLFLLMGIGPYVNWKRDTLDAVAGRLRIVVILSLVAAAILVAVSGVGQNMAGIIGVLMACWVLFTAPLEVVKRWRSKTHISRAILGMTLAHFGIGLTVLGVSITAVASNENDLAFSPGQSRTVAQYEFKFTGMRRIQGPNYTGEEGEFIVYENGSELTRLYPQKRNYFVQQNTMTEADIDAGLFRDLYVAIGEPLGDGSWSARVQVKPFIRFMWLGPLFMALGGVFAAFDRRYRPRTSNEVSS